MSTDELRGQSLGRIIAHKSEIEFIQKEMTALFDVRNRLVERLEHLESQIEAEQNYAETLRRKAKK